MAKFLVVSTAEPTRDAVFALIVDAADAAEAKLLAAARVDGDAAWSGATVTDLTAAFKADYEGYVYRVRVGNAPDAVGGNLIDVSYTAVASDTVDLIGAALATLLNATDEIAGAAYNTSTNVLKIAETTDALGDHSVLVTVTPPNAIGPLTTLVGAVVHQGASGAVLSAVLESPAAIPAIGFALGKP